MQQDNFFRNFTPFTSISLAKEYFVSKENTSEIPKREQTQFIHTNALQHRSTLPTQVFLSVLPHIVEYKWLTKYQNMLKYKKNIFTFQIDFFLRRYNNYFLAVKTEQNDFLVINDDFIVRQISRISIR